MKNPPLLPESNVTSSELPARALRAEAGRGKGGGTGTSGGGWQQTLSVTGLRCYCYHYQWVLTMGQMHPWGESPEARGDSPGMALAQGP